MPQRTTSLVKTPTRRSRTKSPATRSRRRSPSILKSSPRTEHRKKSEKQSSRIRWSPEVREKSQTRTRSPRREAQYAKQRSKTVRVLKDQVDVDLYKARRRVGKTVTCSALLCSLGISNLEDFERWDDAQERKQVYLSGHQLRDARDNAAEVQKCVSNARFCRAS